jgi:membrane protease YdiL (CAAX protease family)
MKRKLFAVAFGLFFPFLHMLIGIIAREAAFAIELARARGRFPDLEDELLRNHAINAFRAAAPLLLIITAVLTLLVIFLTFPRLLKFVGTGGLKPSVLLSVTGAALGLSLALGAMIGLLPLPESWISEHTDRVSSPLGAGGAVLRLICIVVAAPLVEEVVFRGLCFNFFRRAFSLPAAILLQAALFASFHGARLQMLYAFLAAAVLALVYAWCKTLLAPLILHMGFNAVNLPLPAAEWGLWLCLLAGAAVLTLGLRGVWFRTAGRPAPSNTSPHPPQ